jgi:hypothetical protein
LITNTGKDLNIKKPETEPEDTLGLLLSIFDSLNNLYEKLNRLNYLLNRKNMELIIYGKNNRTDY